MIEAKYDESIDQIRRRAKAFTYHPPHGDQAQRYEEIRNMANNVAASLAVRCPDCRELSLAMTKLEEVVFWANAAIARNETHEAPAKA